MNGRQLYFIFQNCVVAEKSNNASNIPQQQELVAEVGTQRSRNVIEEESEADGRIVMAPPTQRIVIETKQLLKVNFIVSANYLVCTLLFRHL